MDNSIVVWFGLVVSGKCLIQMLHSRMTLKKKGTNLAAVLASLQMWDKADVVRQLIGSSLDEK